jgi:DNA polymerase
MARVSDESLDVPAEFAALAHALQREYLRRRWHGEKLRRLGPTPAPSAVPRVGPTTVRSVPAPAAQPVAAPVAAPVARPAAPVMAPLVAASGAPPSTQLTQPSAVAPGAPARIAPACADLAGLRAAVAACRACVLCETRTNTVFMDGTGSSGILFVGEAPGETEDQRGVPFVGRAGELLTDIITKGMGLERSAVAIANVLKCRPPGNREPAPNEKELCTPFLERQIELLRPRIVIALGKHAAGYLLQSDASMAQLRGRVHRRGELKVVVTYHPAYLLRTPSAKKDCWQDIQLAMREIGLAVPAKSAAGGAAASDGAAADAPAPP